MTVRFFAYYRGDDYAGCKELTRPAPKTLRELGDQLCAELGPKFAGEFYASDKTALGEKIIIMVNGRRTDFLQGLDTPLKDDDLVQIFPVVAGG